MALEKDAIMEDDEILELTEEVQESFDFFENLFRPYFAKKNLEKEMMKEAEQIMKEVEANPALKDVKVPDGIWEKLLERIRKEEHEKEKLL